MASMLVLGGCSDVYRFLVGPADAPPAAGPNAAAFQAGAQQPYPNLATVPPPPVQTLTAAQRAAMANGLIADRANARYADAQVRDSDANANIAKLLATPVNVPMQRMPGSPGRVAADGRPRPAPVGQVSRTALPGSKPASRPSGGGEELTSGGALGAASAPTADDSGLSAGGALGGAPAAPAPRLVPQPEATRPPPPPPSLPPTPPVTTGPAPAPAPTSTPAATAPTTSTTAAAPMTAMPSAPAIASAPSLGAAPATAPAPAAVPHGESRIGSVAVKSGDVGAGESAVAAAAAAFKKDGGKLRVVGAAPAGQPTGDATSGTLSNYQGALANAAAVKKALVAAGVPAAQIVTEAASKPAQSDHADILIEH